VKALEIQQSLIDSRIEKMASKTIEKIDELQRLFVILQKRIKEHKKLLQRLEEQRDSLVLITALFFGTLIHLGEFKNALKKNGPPQLSAQYDKRYINQYQKND